MGTNELGLCALSSFLILAKSVSISPPPEHPVVDVGERQRLGGHPERAAGGERSARRVSQRNSVSMMQENPLCGFAIYA